MREMLYTILTIHERVQERSPDAHSCSSEGDCLKDIRAALETAIDVDFELLENFGTLFSEL